MGDGFFVVFFTGQLVVVLVLASGVIYGLNRRLSETRNEADAWRQKYLAAEEELSILRRPHPTMERYFGRDPEDVESKGRIEARIDNDGNVILKDVEQDA